MFLYKKGIFLMKNGSINYLLLFPMFALKQNIFLQSKKINTWIFNKLHTIWYIWLPNVVNIGSFNVDLDCNIFFIWFKLWKHKLTDSSLPSQDSEETLNYF